MAEITITQENFETEVLKSEKPVLVDFWAVWCGPCQMLAPVIEELGTELAGKIRVGKVNVDEQPQLAMRYGVESIPTVLLFENGAPVKASVGYRSKDALKAELSL